MDFRPILPKVSEMDNHDRKVYEPGVTDVRWCLCWNGWNHRCRSIWLPPLKRIFRPDWLRQAWHQHQTTTRFTLIRQLERNWSRTWTKSHIRILFEMVGLYVLDLFHIQMAWIWQSQHVATMAWDLTLQLVRHTAGHSKCHGGCRASAYFAGQDVVNICCRGPVRWRCQKNPKDADSVDWCGLIIPWHLMKLDHFSYGLTVCRNLCLVGTNAVLAMLGAFSQVLRSDCLSIYEKFRPRCPSWQSRGHDDCHPLGDRQYQLRTTAPKQVWWATCFSQCLIPGKELETPKS